MGNLLSPEEQERQGPPEVATVELDHRQLPRDPELDAPRDALNEARSNPKKYLEKPSPYSLGDPAMSALDQMAKITPENDPWRGAGPPPPAVAKEPSAPPMDAAASRVGTSLGRSVTHAAAPSPEPSFRKIPASWPEGTPITSDPGMDELAAGLSRTRLDTLRQDTNPGRGRSPATGQAQALLAKLKPQDYPDYPKERETVADVPRTPLQPRKDGGRPPEPFSDRPQVASHLDPSQTPPAPGQAGERPDTTEDSLLAAQRRRMNADREARYASAMSQASDTISQRARPSMDPGEDIRAGGEQGVQDVIAQQAEAQRKANEGRAVEDQGFQRAGEQRAQGVDSDRKVAAGAAQAMNTPGNREAKAYEAIAQGLYGAKVQQIPPAQRAAMSANDWKAALAELQQQNPKAGGAGAGGKAEDKEVIQRAKMIPKNAKGMYDMLDTLDGIISSAGGIDKLEGVGGFMGIAALRPGATMNPESQQFRSTRQMISNMSSNQLFGSALSPTEAGRFDKAVSDVATGNTAEQVMNGMRVVREMTKSAYDQSQAGISPGARARIERDIGGLAKPLAPRSSPAPGQAQPPPPPPGPGVLTGKSGRKFRLNPDGSADEV